MSVRRHFDRFRAPGEDEAEARSWRVVRAAFEEARPVRAPARRRLALPRLAAAAAAGAAAIALVVTPAGSAVADWIEDVVERDEGAALEPLRLPGPGRLIVNTASGPWILNRDGSKRLLGGYDDASWSPKGLFVVATRGNELFALEPGGRVRWEIPTAGRPSAPRWAPSGFRIAYLAGGSLWVVAGDGTGDRRSARAGAAPPAWRPGGEHVLAYADRSGRVVVSDVDSGRTLWRSRPGRTVRELAWSADAARLAAVRDGSLQVFDGRGTPLRTVRVRRTGPATAATMLAFDPKSHDLAVVRDDGEVVVLRADRRAGAPRRLFAGPGGIGGLAWSPDGRWLLIAWDGSDQWLFVSPGARRPVRATDRISRRFDPGAPAGPELPGRVEWCC